MERNIRMKGPQKAKYIIDTIAKAGYDSSMSNPIWAENRIARKMRRESSPKRSSGLPTAPPISTVTRQWERTRRKRFCTD